MSVTHTHRLENGDRLTRSAFEWLCEQQGISSAELIDGVVHMAAAVRFREHGEPTAMLVLWLGHYAIRRPDVRFADNTSVRLDERNEPQPDAILVYSPAAGGLTRVADDGILEGPPELVIEVAASSVSIDLHQKKDMYAKAGVPEYLVWRTEDRAIDWFRLTVDVYQPMEPDGEGLVRSQIFPGLVLDARAMINGRMKQVLETLDR